MKKFMKILGIALAYALAGKWGLRLAFVNASATAVWAPTGIALAALLVFGVDFWPGVLLGAFLVNIATAGTVATSCGIAAGNTLEVVLGAFLVNRFAHGRSAFNEPHDIFKFTLLAGILSTTVSATVGVTSLALGGFASWNTFGNVWLTWWLGDMSGALMIAPLLVLWSSPYHPRWERSQLPELGLLLAALLIFGEIVFGGYFQKVLVNYPLDYLYIPLVVWAAYRFGEREAMTASVLLLGMAIWGTLHGFGPFVRPSPNASLLLMQTFMMIVTFTGLVLAVMVSRHKESEEEDRRKAEEALDASESRYRQLLESNIVGFMIVNWEGQLLDANDAFLRLLGYTRQDLKAGRIGGNSLTPEEYRPLDEWMRAKLLDTGVCPPVEKEYFRKDGSRVAVLVGVVFHPEPEEHLVCLVMDASERRLAMAALQRAYDEMETRVTRRTSELAAANTRLNREIERRKQAETALQSLAITDPLTGLYNRRGFVTLASQLLKQAKRAQHPFLLILADVDGLKGINDLYGHLEGDQAINAVAAILKDTFRASDVIARLGGDEFAVGVIEDLSESERDPLLERLQEKTNAFNAGSHKSYALCLSVGAAELKSGDIQTLDFLIGEADKVLYEDKNRKKLRLKEA